jgi:four helix bundle protein
MSKTLNQLEVYILAENLSNQIWDIVIKWNYFEKYTIGKQLTRAVDSIGANIAECHGRYHYNDKQKFGYYARGSFEETRSWLRKSHYRKLLNENQVTIIDNTIKKLGPKLNSFIKALGNH